MNSISISINVLKRIFGQINIVVLFLFPIIACIMAVVMVDNPTVYKVGIEKTNENQSIYQTLNDRYEYDLVELKEENIKEQVDEELIDMGLIFDLDGEERVEIISKKSGDYVENLKLLLNGYYNAVEGNIPLEPEKDLSDAARNEFELATGVFLMALIMSVGLSITILLDDRKDMTFMRLYSLPVRKESIVLGYMLALFIVGLLQITLFLVFAKILGITLMTSIINVIILLSGFLLACIGLAIGLTGFIKDKSMYSVLVTFVALISSFLSGSFIPIELMGEKMKYVSYFLPQSWVVGSLLRLNKGDSLINIMPNILVLVLFSVVFFTFGTKILARDT